MPRRPYASRRLSLESLEERCNPAALVPLADFVADPAPAASQGIALASVTDFVVDPFDPHRIYQEKPADQRALPKVSAYSMVIDPRTSSAPAKPVSLNSFAGQRVNILIDAADASAASQDVGGYGSDRLVGGTGQDQRNAGAPTGRLFLGTNVGVFVSADGLDVLIGGAGRDDSRSSGPAISDVLTLQGDRLDPAATRNGVASAQLNLVGSVRDI